MTRRSMLKRVDARLTQCRIVRRLRSQSQRVSRDDSALTSRCECRARMMNSPCMRHCGHAITMSKLLSQMERRDLRSRPAPRRGGSRQAHTRRVRPMNYGRTKHQMRSCGPSLRRAHTGRDLPVVLPKAQAKFARSGSCSAGFGTNSARS
jgi:hypothetical protein